MENLEKEELSRYSRQIMLDEVGLDGQLKIKKAKVLVVGAGGLGCPVLQYLGAAGVGTIGIVDFDTVEIHNLQRQILYASEDIGKPKAQTAAEKIKAANPNISCIVFNLRLQESNAVSIISQFDIIVNGPDNFMTRYLVNDVCVKLNRPMVYGSILNFEGQLAVLNYNGSKNLRDIYPEHPNQEDLPKGNEIGVMGFVPGIIGLYMANATIQIILELYKENNLLLFDFKQLNVLKLKI
jgi:adenylyltransferase/sulfurtransferase